MNGLGATMLRTIGCQFLCNFVAVDLCSNNHTLLVHGDMTYVEVIAA